MVNKLCNRFSTIPLTTLKVKIFSIQRTFLFLAIITAFSGTVFFSIEVGPIHIFPYRIFIIIISAFFFFFLLYIYNGRLNLSYIKVKLHLKFLLLWFAYAFLSIMWSADQIAALRNIIFLLTGLLLIFFMVYYIRNLKHLKWLYWLWILVFIALIPIGLWEINTGNHLSMSKLYEDDRSWLVFAPTTVFTNPNDYAAYIALTIPMMLSWIRYYPNICSRIVGLIVLSSAILLLAMTTSRACYIAVAIGLIFWFTCLLKVRTKVRLIFIGVMVVFGTVLSFPQQIQDMFAMIQMQFNSLFIYDTQVAEGSIGVRQNLLKNAVYFVIQSFGFGVGAGNIEYYVANHAVYPVGGITNLHNWWMEIMVNYGLFIFCGYVILYLSFLYNLWRIHKCADNVTEKMICEALLVGVVSFFMASISSSSIMSFPPQWILMGFILAFLNYTRVKTSKRCNPCTF